MSEELESEVLTMCNLSQGVRAEGREEGRKEGINIGEIGMLVQLVRDGDLKPERAAEKAKMTVEDSKNNGELPIAGCIKQNGVLASINRMIGQPACMGFKRP